MNFYYEFYTNQFSPIKHCILCWAHTHFQFYIECHYLIADASGHSVIVEFYDDELQVVETETDYQIATNFVAYNGLNIGEGFTEFERYDAVALNDINVASAICAV